MIMGLKCHLPFEAGQEAESKCFIEGFRSAWFRCKIKKISYRGQQIGYNLEYFDYPGEKTEWIRAYQKPPHEENKMELMLRPSFPLICRESQLNVFPESDVIAVMDGTWKVGDLVDWWCDNCYWSARVIGLAGKDTVKDTSIVSSTGKIYWRYGRGLRTACMIQLPKPPIGEGNLYAAFCKDLRPSLDWSPENGWTVPLSKESGNRLHCARLIWLHSEGKGSRDKHTLVESTAERNDSGFDINPGNPGIERSNSLSTASDYHDVKPISSVLAMKPKRDRYSLGTTEEKRITEYRYLASVKHSDTIESSIIELEELANKIRWLKGFLQVGFQWSNAMKPSWRILKNGGC